MIFHLIRKIVFINTIRVEKTLILKYKKYKENTSPHQNNRRYIEQIKTLKFKKA